MSEQPTKLVFMHEFVAYLEWLEDQGIPVPSEVYWRAWLHAGWGPWSPDSKNLFLWGIGALMKDFSFNAKPIPCHSPVLSVPWFPPVVPKQFDPSEAALTATVSVLKKEVPILTKGDIRDYVYPWEVGAVGATPHGGLLLRTWGPCSLGGKLGGKGSGGHFVIPRDVLEDETVRELLFGAWEHWLFWQPNPSPVKDISTNVVVEKDIVKQCLYVQFSVPVFCWGGNGELLVPGVRYAVSIPQESLHHPGFLNNLPGLGSLKEAVVMGEMSDNLKFLLKKNLTATFAPKATEVKTQSKLFVCWAEALAKYQDFVPPWTLKQAAMAKLVQISAEARGVPASAVFTEVVANWSAFREVVKIDYGEKLGKVPTIEAFAKFRYWALDFYFSLGDSADTAAGVSINGPVAAKFDKPQTGADNTPKLSGSDAKAHVQKLLNEADDGST